MTSGEPAETHNTVSGGIQFSPVVQGRDIDVFFQLPVQTPVALAQLPGPAVGFTGREEELKVLAGLLNPAAAGAAGAVVVSAVAGLAGVGKTALAVQAGHAARALAWFPGGVLFIDLQGYGDQPVQPAQALDALLRALGIGGEHIPPTEAERAGLYRSVLAQITQPVLMIADNASTEAQVRPLLPGGGPHRVLVTSRHTLAGLPARLLDIAVLDPEAAVALLEGALRAARPDDDRITADPGAARELAGVCGGLPLALQITASLLKADPTLSAATLAQELAAGRLRLERLVYDDGGGAAAPSVAAAFEASYRRLDGTEERMFRLLAAHPGPQVSTGAAAALAGLPLIQARPVLAGLARAHLLESAPGSVGRWRMHDLLVLYAQQLSDQHADADGREQALDRLLGYYLDMADAADRHLKALPGTKAPEVFTGQADALAWLDTERPGLVAAVAMAVGRGRDQVAMELPIKLANFFDWRRRPDDQLATSKASLDVARRLGDLRHQAMALDLVGSALREVGRVDEAIVAHQDAVVIYWGTGDRIGEAIALTNLGNALTQVRQYEKAITAFEEGLAICRETNDRHSEAVALTSLAGALQEKRQDEEADIAIGRGTISWRWWMNYPRSEGVLDTGEEEQRFRQASIAGRQAVVIFRETGDRHGEARALTSLGNALCGEEQFEEAGIAYDEAAAIFRETGDRHREARALTSLGDAFSWWGEFNEAITAYQEAVAIFRETGDRHGKATALNHLGAALFEIGQFEEAITVCQEAVAIFRETGDRHGEGTVLNHLGEALFEIGQREEAINAHQEAVVIFRETGDRHHEAIAIGNFEWDVAIAEWHGGKG